MAYWTGLLWAICRFLTPWHYNGNITMFVYVWKFYIILAEKLKAPGYFLYHVLGNSSSMVWPHIQDVASLGHPFRYWKKDRHVCNSGRPEEITSIASATWLEFPIFAPKYIFIVWVSLIIGEKNVNSCIITNFYLPWLWPHAPFP